MRWLVRRSELGAQNLYAADDGAYTGEINAGMLTDVGCRYVILGHSERRALMGETDAIVNEKLNAALAGNLIPIVCVGETLADREAGNTEQVVESQIRGSLAGLGRSSRRRNRHRLRTSVGDRHGKNRYPAASRRSPCVHPQIAEPIVHRRRSVPNPNSIWWQCETGQRQGIARPAEYRRGPGWRCQPERR